MFCNLESLSIYISFENPETFSPNTITAVNIELQDINYTFKKGHKLQILLQRSWLSLIDMNPQTYIDNIFKAEENYFKKQEHIVLEDSKIVFYRLK